MVVIFNLPGLFLYWLLRPSETLATAYDRALEEEAIMQDLEERSACPGCKQPVQADFQICPNCSTKLKRQCPELWTPAQSEVECLPLLCQVDPR